MEAAEFLKSCPNCDYVLEQEFEYCPRCGQKVLQKKDFSIRHLVVDSVGDYFHFDGKFFHSLVPLLLNPGKMTVEYIQGKRARFIPPFKLVLFISVVYFIVVGQNLKEGSEFQIDRKETTDSSPSGHKANADDLHLTFSYGNRKIDSDSIRKAVKEQGIDAVVSNFKPESWIEKVLAYQAVHLALEGGAEFSKRLLHNASKVVFVLIPFVALLLKLIYIRRKRLYFDHLIFSIHFHSFLFLLLLIFQLITSWIISLPVWIIPLIIIPYLLLALKKVYRQGWWKTSLKLVVSGMMYLLIAIPVFAILLFVVTILI